MWLIAAIAISTPLWSWLLPQDSPSLVFVPVTGVRSSFGGVLGGLFLVLVAAGCGHGMPRGHLRASRMLLAGSGTSRLNRRIAVLTASRTGALEVQAAELRRIERDLHDGAQARLVSVGMLLGLLELKVGRLPDDNRRLLGQARADIGVALQELWDPVRGVYPPILADRGLARAIESLAELAGPTVVVTVDVPQRLPAALKSTVYFVVAEGLARRRRAHSRRRPS
ncbi:sensor histidine kinase [Kutzneria sp. 744]|uniref:sensor histidine kinase n=1 Tax=Kutzneria sp. (strain 744) TaxID=345341 RepID=UPI0003EEAA29|nr:histidine kinase [Kutzneria sp. 744]EWM10076.1 two-component system sensor kinase [Kutzneria sp. 744]